MLAVSTIFLIMKAVNMSEQSLDFHQTTQRKNPEVIHPVIAFSGIGVLVNATEGFHVFMAVQC
jgi:hypothetical protein